MNAVLTHESTAMLLETNEASPTDMLFTTDGDWSNSSRDWVPDWMTSAPSNESYIPRCDSHIVQYKIVPALIFASCFIFGVMYCFFGKDVAKISCLFKR